LANNRRERPRARGVAAFTKSTAEGQKPLYREVAKVQKAAMNDEALKAAVGQFLKYVTGTAQSELEKAVRKAIASGKLRANEPCSTGVTLSIEKAGMDVTIYGNIKL